MGSISTNILQLMHSVSRETNVHKVRTSVHSAPHGCPAGGVAGRAYLQPLAGNPYLLSAQLGGAVLYVFQESLPR